MVSCVIMVPLKRGDILQKLLKIRAAFSTSLSIGPGRKASEPILLARALMGAAALVPHPASF